MYEKDGIMYAGNPTPMTRIIYAEYAGDSCIRVAFSDGAVKVVDFSVGFEGTAFQPLKNREILKNFTVQRDTLTWLNDEIDVAPEYLYEIGQTEVEAMAI